MDKPMVMRMPVAATASAEIAPDGYPPDDERAMMREMLDFMDQGVILYERDAGGEETVAFFNARAESQLELPPGMLRRGLMRREIVDYCERRGDHRNEIPIEDHLNRILRGEQAEILSRRPSGQWVLARSIPRRSVPGSLTLYINVTEHIVSAQRLRRSQTQYRAIAETAPLGFVQLDPAGRILFVNPAAARMFGDLERDVDLEAVLHPATGRPLRIELEQSDRFEAELHVPGGHRHLMVAVSRDDACVDADRIIAFTDITLLKTARLQVEKMARHDPLTGLGNRTLLKESWAELEPAPGRPVRQGVFIALDLDHFKLINDDYGHETGDRLLCMVAERMRETLGKKGSAFRLGGDEFAVILAGRSRAEGIRLAEALVYSLSKPYRIDDRTLVVGCSAGVASLPKDGATPEQLQRAADVALYQVKRNGRNAVACYDAEQEEQANERRRLEADLTLALSREAFTLVYQPQFDLGTGRISGIEALIRWYNRRLGRMVAPSDFIPIAERIGLITLIDNWVIRTAIAHLAKFRAAAPDCPGLSINLSPISLERREIVARLTETLEAYRVPPELLEIEITEGITIKPGDPVVETLHAIQQAGIKIAIDDFGAGQTSLTYIRSLPVNRVKIDRSIIEGVGNDHTTRAIVGSIHHLCMRLGLKMTAEGIETEDQWRELCRLGAVDGQGFYLGPPEPGETLLARLTEARGGTPLLSRTTAAG
ncbi:putative bifunctional diguanylate cyclase/phosphodiesterase [Jiella sp. M17.18]|uniref:putative bifunctional diguanylate cyclase/phosphodiesterase n=1 Tax=Jiella sp. M17.18 TaxID=3234247 RepID=UPI0034DEE8EC